MDDVGNDENHTKRKLDNLLKEFSKEFERDNFPSPTNKEYRYPDINTTKLSTNRKQNETFKERLKALKKLEKKTIAEENRNDMCVQRSKRKTMMKTARPARTTRKPNQRRFKHGRSCSETALNQMHADKQHTPSCVYNNSSSKNCDRIQRCQEEKRTIVKHPGENDEVATESDRKSSVINITFNGPSEMKNQSDTTCKKISTEHLFKQLAETEKRLFRLKISEERDLLSIPKTDEQKQLEQKQLDEILTRRIQSAREENRYRTSSFSNKQIAPWSATSPHPLFHKTQSSLDQIKTKSLKQKPIPKKTLDFEKIRLEPRDKRRDNHPHNHPDSEQEDRKPTKFELKTTCTPLKFYMSFVTNSSVKVPVRTPKLVNFVPSIVKQ